MSREWMQKTLMKLGFNEPATKVYLFLLEQGPQNVKSIAEALGIHRQKLYRILKKLKDKGAITNSSEFPTALSAVLFEKILDLSIKAKMEQQKALKASKEELLSTWRSLTERDEEKS